MIKKAFKILFTITGFGMLWYLEQMQPLRRQTQNRVSRALVNVGLAGFTFAVIVGSNWLLIRPTLSLVSRKKIGLLNRVSVPPRLRRLLAFLWLDYTLYIWHRLNHRLPFFWRFHLVHHSDLDMDTSTSVRFHFGELFLSILFRILQIAAIGAEHIDLLVFDNVLLVAIRFHHSNLRLPTAFEKKLNFVIVTPRMHGIHHSIVLEETNSNWSTVFSFWDKLHGSFVSDVPQSQITIGVPAYRDPEELRLANLLGLPFRPLRPWLLPDGATPARQLPGFER
ncbi:MAG TPA: sterol desaturase family protein [Acidobacteriota bacterium]|nr:sterol desaturase family protein [Acidobacteriota bacterium]